MELAIAENKAALTSCLGVLRRQGKRIALVPTMGALHAGHASLIRYAKSHADAVAVSIFVNPKQFGAGEDFSRYPRTFDSDLALLTAEGADIAYVPDVADMYAKNAVTCIHVPGISEGLCGVDRPGHFDGVALVVTKLLLRMLPDVAVFGEKDYQQLMVIRRLVADLDIPVEILGAPIIREADGLALSSRNRYLAESERKIAPLLYQVLNRTAAYLRQHPYNVDNALAVAAYDLSHQAFDAVHYVELRAAESFTPLAVLDAPARLLAAVRIGNTRLIDNVAV